MNPLSAICRQGLALIVAVLAFDAAPAVAGDTVVGSGRMDCDEYLQSDEAVKLSVDNWVLGYFSFANLRSYNLDLLRNLDNGTLIEAVEGFCHEHPSARIADASAALLKTLVASADADCAAEGAAPGRRLSLCRIPGAAGGSGVDFEWFVPGVE